jgi:excisionase family DNA binding protein
VPNVLTTTTAAAMLGLSRPTLMKMIADGEIPSHKVGSHHRLAAEDVLQAKCARRHRQRAAFSALRELDDSSE